MLEALHLKNVGPAPKMDMGLAPRLNLITGDNGLGKSFLLDVAWWALTRTWARFPIVPESPKQARIGYSYTKKTKGLHSYESRFDPTVARWAVKAARPPIPGLILYAQVDGGFSVWDPARNYWRDEGHDRPRAFLFSPDEVWNGNALCEGLIRDWGSWQREGAEAFDTLKQVLELLSPPAEPLVPGDLRKLTVDDPRRYPTLRMPYGEDVPVIHASAGMRRIIALTYLLVWTWQEHVEAAKLREEEPAREIVFLIDEIEAHLHPKWQRRIVPALLKVMEVLTRKHGSHVQLIAATHSPLVLASAEPFFDVDDDAWFDLDLEEGAVHLRKRPFVRRGEVGNWLTSEAFDLKEPRSFEGEEAVRAALELVKQPNPSDPEVDAVDAKLHSAGLPDIDRFWVRWGYFMEQRKAKSGEPVTSKTPLEPPKATKSPRKGSER